MLKKDAVFTIESGKTVERAARVLSDHKIVCLPVVEDGNVVVGIISEVDLLRSFQEMLGLPSDGVRVTIRMPDQSGEFAKVTSVLAANELCVMGIGSFPSPRQPGFYDLVIKISGTSLQEVESTLKQVEGQELVDIRQIV
jgi:acetoin utilization protein AcuB